MAIKSATTTTTQKSQWNFLSAAQREDGKLKQELVQYFERCLTVAMHICIGLYVHIIKKKTFFFKSKENKNEINLEFSPFRAHIMWSIALITSKQKK